MDIERAREILEANHMIQVTLSGIPVFIQKLNEDGMTAQVFPLDEPDHEQMVTLNELNEI